MLIVLIMVGALNFYLVVVLRIETTLKIRRVVRKNAK